MTWRIEFDRQALREFEKLDRASGPDRGEFWRYRVGSYRIVARLKDKEPVIPVLRVGHRREGVPLIILHAANPAASPPPRVPPAPPRSPATAAPETPAGG